MALHKQSVGSNWLDFYESDDEPAQIFCQHLKQVYTEWF
jgi:hypothetical protein